MRPRQCRHVYPRHHRLRDDLFLRRCPPAPPWQRRARIRETVALMTRKRLCPDTGPACKRPSCTHLVQDLKPQTPPLHGAGRPLTNCRGRSGAQFARRPRPRLGGFRDVPGEEIGYPVDRMICDVGAHRTFTTRVKGGHAERSPWMSQEDQSSLRTAAPDGDGWRARCGGLARRILGGGGCGEKIWNVLCRPGSDLLSRGLSQSTIGAEGFHGRVRNGIGCMPLAKATRPAEDVRS